MDDADVKHWIYAGGIDYDLTEGDLICVFSQYGEVDEIVLSRDRDTGKPRGFGFVKYNDPRSCELAVDNFNGTTVSGRRMKVSSANNLNVIRSIKATAINAASNRDNNNRTTDDIRRDISNYESRRPFRARRRDSESSGSEIEIRSRQRGPAHTYPDDRRPYISKDLTRPYNNEHYNRGDNPVFRNGFDRPNRYDQNSRFDLTTKQQRTRPRSRSTSSSSSSTSSSSDSSSSSSSSSTSSSASGGSSHRKRSRKDSHKKKKLHKKHHHRRHKRHTKSKSSKHDHSSDEESSKRHRHKKSKRSSSPSSHGRKRKSKSKAKSHRARSRSRSPSGVSEEKSSKSLAGSSLSNKPPKSKHDDRTSSRRH